jgi:hypothetical protein
MNNLSGLLFLDATRFGSYVSIRPVVEAIGALLSSLGDDRSPYRMAAVGFETPARFSNSPLPQRANPGTSKESGNERPPDMGGGSVSCRVSTSRSAVDDGRDQAMV